MGAQVTNDIDAMGCLAGIGMLVAIVGGSVLSGFMLQRLIEFIEYLCDDSEDDPGD